MALGLAIPTPAAALNKLDESNTFVCTGRNVNADFGDELYTLHVTTQVWFQNLGVSAVWNDGRGQSPPWSRPAHLSRLATIARS
jgi:hypothetical protein